MNDETMRRAILEGLRAWQISKGVSHKQATDVDRPPQSMLDMVDSVMSRLRAAETRTYPMLSARGDE